MPDILNRPTGTDKRLQRYRLDIRGIVQGVGFRPFLYRLAQKWGLSGFAANTPQGVVAEIEGEEKSVTGLLRELPHALPANAVIHDIGTSVCPVTYAQGFYIDATLAQESGASVSIPPDLATCSLCLEEIFDPANRRYLYPFTNCTGCGPRYSLIERLPYDRAHTAMRHFPMCAHCRAEYENPQDRRFHAEPNACPECGPELTLCVNNGERLAQREEALQMTADALRDGRIVALKGLGGFQLLTDARNAGAVALLRRRKNRPHKPFALMGPSLADVRRICHVSHEEERLLKGRERPVVLLRRRAGITDIASAVAPDDNPYLGVMLPYTPLHHILMAELNFPVVATSGNRAGEPIASRNEDALARLGDIADLFLLHDRPIVRPLDDSVARIVAHEVIVLRRARGYAPLAVPVKNCRPGIVAMGGHLKAAVAVTGDESIMISQYIGDLDTSETRDVYDAALKDAIALQGVAPWAVACDLHPDYYSTVQAEKMGLPSIRVQHHVAHAAAVMAEHGLEPPLTAIVWDGAGYGPDGSLWGGEVLHIDEVGWERLAHMRPFRLPGGAVAIWEPVRAAIGLLYELYDAKIWDHKDLHPVNAFSGQEQNILQRMLETGTNAPHTSSVGRLFDAVSALLGLCLRVSYEGQAACRLEWALPGENDDRAYKFPLKGTQIDWKPALERILQDIRDGVASGIIASAFHRGLVSAILDAARRSGEKTVVLGGGCFQNPVLLEGAIVSLRQAGFRPCWSQAIPPNDGGLSLGQAFWAARRIGSGDNSCAWQFQGGSLQ